MTSPRPLTVPDPQALAAVQAVCDLPAPYAFPKDHAATFAKAMQEITRWHAGHSDFYRRALAAQGFDPKTKLTPATLATLPWIPATFFKSHEVMSIGRDAVQMHLTSSGTTGQKSQMFFDEWSLRSGQRMVDRTFEALGFITPDTPTNYLLYSYEPEAVPGLGTAYTDNYLCQFAPVNKAFCALRRTGTGSHDFDVFGCIERLAQYEAEGKPVRIFGFPAFLYFTLQRMQGLGTPKLKLAEGSLIFLGGGWKGNADKAVSKTELYGLVNELLGIDDRLIRDSFGAVEHAIPYSECERHHFHVPVWSQVIIRDVRTLAPLGFGEPGFLQFMTPFITSVPAHSVLMGDLASLYPAEACGCGIPSPYFEVHGRAGTTKNRSCAIAASEMLGR